MQNVFCFNGYLVQLNVLNSINKDQIVNQLTSDLNVGQSTVLGWK